MDWMGFHVCVLGWYINERPFKTPMSFWLLCHTGMDDWYSLQVASRETKAFRGGRDREFLHVNERERERQVMYVLF